MCAFFIALSLLPCISNAQVKEGASLMSLGNHNALSIELPQVKPEFAEKIWKNFVKEYKGKYSKIKKTQEYMLDNAMIPGLGAGNTVDVHSIFTPSGENTMVTVWFNLGGAFLSSAQYRDQYNEAEKLVLKYGIAVAAEQTKRQLEDQKDALEKMERDLKRLENKNADLHKDIDNWKNKIKQAEADIEANKKQQEEQKGKIGDQRRIVEDVQKKLEGLKQ